MADDLSAGMLVEWQGRPHAGYGVVTATGNRRVTVAWDSADEETTQFALHDNSLLRVNLPQGTQARRRSTNELVIIQSDLGSVTPAKGCLVISGEGSTRVENIPEADLRPKPVTEPAERFKSGQVGGTDKYLLRQVADLYLNLHLHDDLVSLGQSQVDIQPHQVSVVHRATREFPHRFLLCDETGLGKTIEAGMIIKELRARGGAQRVLIICPANLVRQWQGEMRSKFNEEFAVLNRQTVDYLRSDQAFTGNPFDNPDHDSVICSASWITRSPWRELCLDAEWDLVIVDEAHHARRHADGETTQLYDLVQSLVGGQNTRNRSALFLTATPMQIHPLELYGLVEILDPTLFLSEDDFTEHRSRMRGLSHLVESLLAGGQDLPWQDGEALQAISEWLEETPEATMTRISSGDDGLRETARLLTSRHRLSEVMFRNRKSRIGGFTPRSANRWAVTMTEPERAALSSVEDYVTYGYSVAEERQDTSIGFLMVNFQKLTASSHMAILSSLRRRRERLVLGNLRSFTASELEDVEEQTEDDGDIPEAIMASDGILFADPGNQNETGLLDKAIKALESLGDKDSKAETFLRQMREIFRENQQEKVLVFTQFRVTQNLIAKLCTENGWGVNVFHGQLNPLEKDEAISQFRQQDGPQVLVSTEAGGEGRNLQFCHWLVNYDLPWNPMRVEQRIGRIDRIGQTNDVLIGNLFVEDSIEERILDVLENRIHAFEETVGGLDEILGGAEADIRRIMALAADRRDQATTDFAEQFETRKQAAIEAGGMLGDFIMDTRSYQRDIVEQITGSSSAVSADDLENFLLRLIADVGTHIRRRSQSTYALTFQGQFHDRFATALFPQGSTLSAVLGNSVAPAGSGATMLTFGNKIVDTIVALVTADDYEGNTGTRVIKGGDDLQQAEGWLFHYRFNVPGPRPLEELLPVFVDDSGEADTQIGKALVARATRFENERALDGGQDIGTLHSAMAVAEEHAGRHRDVIQADAQARAQERFDLEISRIDAVYEYRKQVHVRKISDLEQRVQGIESLTEEQRRILPVWQARLRGAQNAQLADERERQDRLEELNRYRNPQVSWKLTAIGRVRIMP